MLRLCDKCPTSSLLQNHLEREIEDFHPDVTVQYSQWVSTDRTNLTVQVSTLSELCESLTQKIEKLIPHSFSSQFQSDYLKMRKETLDEGSVLILMDFSENYSFVVQDEAQGFHWNNGSCTLHTVVVYCKINQDLQSRSLCIISDDLDHDVALVYLTQKLVLDFLKSEFPEAPLKHVEYFTDGCAAQYKNCKNFRNICYLEQDFSMKCNWSFFATTHGKSRCDGIGGTLKRLVTKTSLQRLYKDQITTALQVYEFCQKNLKGITGFYVSKEYMVQVRTFLCGHFENAKTIPSTRSMHQFVPLSPIQIGAKRLSCDIKFSIIYDFSLLVPVMPECYVHPNCYVACMIPICINAYRVLVGRPEGKRPLGRPRRRWEDNIKMDLSEVGYDDRDWLNLAQDRDRWRAYVRAAMNLRVP
ncbi:hypothetical protein ANN_21395 [Periplaneta americana]|uniref:Uncharacterized protein n=1 Tax=Periplaneta americana TaxID=6978 RepID=A0ABQ8SGF9_PERAM|nr:hypothetical protein ANN_21395 [Periplaneta americana]